MYAAVTMHPDIAFTVSMLLQFFNNLGELHWDAIKCILHYLSGTKHHKLSFGSE